MSVQENVFAIEGGHAVAERRDRLGDILVADGALSHDEVDRVIALQREKGLRFGDAAVRLALITTDMLDRATAKQFGFDRLAPPGDGASSELVVAVDPRHRRAEEMRTLRVQLLVRWLNAGVSRRMLAVVSAAPDEGRSYVCANLAVSFAQVGERTLLIDGDLRAPRQHQIFDIPNRTGLSAVLAGRADRTAVVSLNAFGSLSVLPAGACPPNPQELLMRPAFVTLVDELSVQFDIIVFDTPPAKLCADAQILALRAGSALVVARRDHSRLRDVHEVISDMSDAGTGVIGTLLNAF